MSKYFFIFTISLKNSIFYRGKLISNAFMITIRVGLLALLYSYTYKYVGKDINNINYQVAIWSIGFYFVLLSMNLRHIIQAYKQDIMSGGIEVMITKPYSYPGYKIIDQIAQGIANFLITAFAILTIFTLFIGRPVHEYNLLWFGALFCVLILGVILASLMYSLAGMSAFWLQDNDPVYWIIDKSVLILGGSYIPVALFPDIMRTIAQNTPMGSINFITYTFYPEFNSIAIRLITTQIIWILILLAMNYLIFKLASKKLAINGG